MEKPKKTMVVAFILLAVWIIPAAPYARVIPSSLLSRNVVARQKMSLEKVLLTRNLAWGAPVYIRVFKAEMRLELWMLQERRFKLFKCYPICTYGGKGPGPKTRRGDGRAPEGFYTVRPGQMNPFSRFHLSINLGYPNAYDRQFGYTGSALMVHGGCVSIGCFAMTNQSMEEIYALSHAALLGGQRSVMVHIFPFEMTDQNLNRYRFNRWYDFWCNLKEGYDLFNAPSGIVPQVWVRDGKYRFAPDR